MQKTTVSRGLLIGLFIGFVVGALTVSQITLARVEAQGTSSGEMEIGNVSIRIGMIKDTAIARLAQEEFTTKDSGKRTDGREIWTIRKGSKIAGNLMIRNDQVAAINRDWVNIEINPQVVTFLKSFQGAFEHAHGTQGTVTFYSLTNRSPQGEHYQIGFLSPGKKREVTLAIFDEKDSGGVPFPTAAVQESISQ